MGKKSPVYTFQRPRNKGKSQIEHYTSTENFDYDDGGQYQNSGAAAKYQKYTFYLFLFMLIVMIGSLIYVQIRGLPVRIKG